jgi:hypothetical protein
VCKLGCHPHLSHCSCIWWICCFECAYNVLSRFDMQLSQSAQLEDPRPSATLCKLVLLLCALKICRATLKLARIASSSRFTSPIAHLHSTPAAGIAEPYRVSQEQFDRKLIVAWLGYLEDASFLLHDHVPSGSRPAPKLALSLPKTKRGYFLPRHNPFCGIYNPHQDSPLPSHSRSLTCRVCLLLALPRCFHPSSCTASARQNAGFDRT